MIHFCPAGSTKASIDQDYILGAITNRFYNDKGS